MLRNGTKVTTYNDGAMDLLEHSQGCWPRWGRVCVRCMFLYILVFEPVEHPESPQYHNSEQNSQEYIPVSQQHMPKVSNK